METIFNKYYVMQDIQLFLCYVVLMLLIIAITVVFVYKELGGKK